MHEFNQWFNRKQEMDREMMNQTKFDDQMELER